jgi:Ni/Fe-hydrogenase 1 B-type cytochrome subunit
MKNNVASGTPDPANQRAIYVFEAPVRIWHWVHVASFFVLAASGYLIANPLPSVGGEASQHFIMGNIRMIHFISAYVFAIGFLVRIYWALVGNRFSREIFILPVWRLRWWRELFEELRLYLFLTRKQQKTLGHPALAQAAMFVFHTLTTIFMICTGFALYGQGLGAGSWADRLFGWIIALLGGGEATHNWHNIGMWVLVAFTIIHIYMAARAEIIGRQSSISAMVSGWRMYKDDLP